MWRDFGGRSGLLQLPPTMKPLFVLRRFAWYSWIGYVAAEEVMRRFSLKSPIKTATATR